MVIQIFMNKQQMKIALFPGGFKPPTIAHYTAADDVSKEVDLVNIIVGGGERDGLSRNDSIKIWEIYIKDLGNKKIQILRSDINSPVQFVYNYIMEVAKPGDELVLVVGEKDNPNRFNSKREDIKMSLFRSKTIISGTKTREIIADNDFETFKKDCLPKGLSQFAIKQIWDIVSSKTESLNEGGNLFSTVGIKQDEVEDTMRDLDEKIFKKLGITDFGLIGSAGKKKEDELSGDLDVGVSIVKLRDKFGGDNKEVLNDLEEKLQQLGYETKVASGFNQVSIPFPIHGRDDKVQVDFMLSTNLKWTKFIYHSANMKDGESQYKGVYRNLLLMAAIQESFKNITKTDKDEIEEYEAYVIRMDQGITQVKKSFKGKDGLIKTAKLLKDFDKFISNDPQELTDLLFTDTKAEDILTYESLEALLKSPKFKFPYKLPKILDKFNNDLKSKNLSLNEGGAAGHLSHPFDELDFTFGDIKELTEKSLNGELSINKDDSGEVTEKTDGQNLMVSWKNGKIIAARKPSEMKDFGSGALGVQDVKDKFKGKDALVKSFGGAMEDLQKSIQGMSEEDKEQYFGNGKRWINLEVIHPETTNTINYQSSILVINRLQTVDENGETIDVSKPDAEALSKKIKPKQKTYTIQGPPSVDVLKHIDFDTKLPYFQSKLSKLQKEFGLSDDNTIGDYYGKSVIKILNANIDIDEKTSLILVDKWLFNGKFNINGIKSLVPKKEDQDWLLNFNKEFKTKTYKEISFNLQSYFLELGVTIMSNMSKFLSTNTDKTIEDIKANLDKSIANIKGSKDPKLLGKLDYHLKRIESIGGFEKIIPSEGLVFKYKGKMLKYTGQFADINAILGILKYSKEIENEENTLHEFTTNWWKEEISNIL